MKKFLYNWLPVAVYFALICGASSLPVQVPAGTDKILHVVLYAPLGFLVTRAILLTKDFSKQWGIVLGSLLVVLLGAGDEFHQSFVPNRQATLGDVMADGVGGWLGALAFVYLGMLLFRSRKLYPDHRDGCC
jgi:VanZ family protein